jgi:hypothetical protein
MSRLPVRVLHEENHELGSARMRIRHFGSNKKLKRKEQFDSPERKENGKLHHLP